MSDVDNPRLSCYYTFNKSVKAPISREKLTDKCKSTLKSLTPYHVYFREDLTPSPQNLPFKSIVSHLSLKQSLILTDPRPRCFSRISDL